jgi:hypothetical protein
MDLGFGMGILDGYNIIYPERVTADGNAAFTDPHAHHGDGFIRIVDDVGEFLHKGDVLAGELIIEGITAVRVHHQDDPLVIVGMLARRSTKGDVGAPELSGAAGLAEGLDLELHGLLEIVKGLHGHLSPVGFSTHRSGLDGL